MLYSEQMKQIAEKMGVNPEEIKDGLYSTMLQKIAEKSGGSGGVSSWNDLTDKPFYEVPEVCHISWDGNMEGRIAIDLSSLGLSDAYAVKVSDTVYSKEELFEKFFRDSDVAEHAVKDWGFDDFAPGIFGVGTEIFVVYSAAELCEALGAPEGYVTNGTYFLRTDNGDPYYIAKLITQGKIKELDKKYLPSDIPVVYDLTDSGDRLDCVLNGGWNQCLVDWSEESRWCAVKNQLEHATIIIKVSVKTSDNSYDTCTADINLGCNANNRYFGTGYGRVYIGGQNTVLQFFCEVYAGVNVSVAAKTIDI